MSRRPAPEGPRTFTVEEANSLVPELVLAFGRLARLRAEAALLVESVGGADDALEVLNGGEPVELLSPDERRLREVVSQIDDVVAHVNGLGCLVKDLETGLVDFYAERDGETVFLCWQFGEPSVAYWHPIEGGFAARQPIEGVSFERPGFLN